MKTLVAVVLIIFGAFMSYVFIGGFLEKKEEEKPVQSSSQQKTAIPETSNTNNPQQTTQKSYTANEVATKNNRENCWLIINNNVYDVSKYISEHPGGASAITPYCGKEASKAFETQDRGSNGGHSNNAKMKLDDYLIGTLN